ncbi:hypothetical protein [Umezawaea beigongshangensis]|uniref:hypothetical protein n=1 Tax=Umezawaea beigongshangensis TaxID=2780383 RepID=UPI0018F110E8|nr:hypothetical protein [Umezawaea beigongshangensis]
MTEPRTTRPRPHAPVQRDETTRYLCAAAHSDPDFADALVREYLSEPTRAITPSPGVDLGAVLREAVAARIRRRSVDAVVVVLFAAFAWASPPFAVLWFAVALVVGAAQLSERAAERAPSGNAVVVRGVVLLVLLVVVLTVVLPLLFQALGPDASDLVYDPRTGRVVDGPVLDTAAIVATVLFLAVAGVVLADRLVVWNLATRSFSRGNFTHLPGEDLWQGEWWVRRLGHGRYRDELAHHPAGGSTSSDTARRGPVALVVHRGFHPFVGAGPIYQPWSLAFPLDPSGERASRRDVRGFAVDELYDALEDDLRGLRNRSSLSPGNRFGELTVFERVVVPAHALVERIDDPATVHVLPDTQRRPRAAVERDRAGELLEQPLEWMRYFRCFQVETWDRNLVISVYLHLGVDAGTLYVEWTPCVLLPLKRRYQQIDQQPSGALRPVADGLADLLQVPVSLVERVVSAFARITPLPQRPGVLLPAKYGALRSVREMASDDDVENYFQRTDLERYVKVLETRVLRATGRFLEEHGISVTEFMSQAQQVVSKNIHIEGPVTGNVFMGDENRVGPVGRATSRKKR